MTVSVVFLAFSLPLGLADLICPDIGSCSLQDRMKGLKEFFRPSLPPSPGSSYTANDLGHFVLKELNYLTSVFDGAIGVPKAKDPPPEGRQYYGTGADYSTGYAEAYPGYSLYGLVGESSASFNGLDAALSALAFLAFGVWLFNLVLPKMQSTGLGLPGLGRRLDLSSFPAVGDEDFSHWENLLLNIFNTSQELISEIFQDGLEQSKNAIHELFEQNFMQNQGKSTIVSAISDFGNQVFKSVRILMNTVQDILNRDSRGKLTKNRNSIVENEATSNSGELRMAAHVPTPSNTSSASRNFSSISNPWISHRWRRETGIGGRGILEDILAKVWQPFDYLAQLLRDNQADYEFPNSRTEITNNDLNHNRFSKTPAGLTSLSKKTNHNKYKLAAELENSMKTGHYFQMKIA